MSWLKIDDHFAENKRVAGVSDRAFRLHVVALCYCARNLTDGYIDQRDTKIVCAILEAPRPARYIAELVAGELWEEVDDGGYVIAGYLEYNPDAVTVKEERRKARLRMQKTRRDKATSSGEGSGEHAPERSREGSPSPSRPVPSLVKAGAVNGEPGRVDNGTAPVFTIPTNLVKGMEAA